VAAREGKQIARRKARLWGQRDMIVRNALDMRIINSSLLNPSYFKHSSGIRLKIGIRSKQTPRILSPTKDCPTAIQK
jgi:hypothetical protein